MPRPSSYAGFCLEKKRSNRARRPPPSDPRRAFAAECACFTRILSFSLSYVSAHHRALHSFPTRRSSDLLLAVLLLLLLVAPCLNCLEAVKKPPPVAFKVMCLLPITIL